MTRTAFAPKMKTKTAALIAVPGLAAVLLGGGVAGAATQRTDTPGTPQQTQVQAGQPNESGQPSATHVTTTRTTATSLPATSGVRHQTGTVTPATHGQDPSHHAPANGPTTVHHEATISNHTSTGDPHDGSDHADHNGGDCH